MQFLGVHFLERVRDFFPCCFLLLFFWSNILQWTHKQTFVLHFASFFMHFAACVFDYKHLPLTTDFPCFPAKQEAKMVKTKVLIQLMKTHIYLYDPANPDHKIKVKQKQEWLVIGQEI